MTNNINPRKSLHLRLFPACSRVNAPAANCRSLFTADLMFFKAGNLCKVGISVININ